jgi:acetyl coenzyme A synthetase (ADP forming)-like protein
VRHSFSDHDHVLRDGTLVHIREIRPDDDERLLAMWDRTSAESRRLRFHGHFDMNPESVKRFTHLDPEDEFAVVATLGRGDRERILGVARWVRGDQPDHAEFATLVEDAHQGRGIGSALVREVAKVAYEVGIRTLTGDILAENSRMLRLVRDIGFEHADHRDMSSVRSDMALDMSETFLRAVDDSERVAARASLARFFTPESVAVVGASRDVTSIGGMVFAHLLQGRFAGLVQPVNPRASVVQSVRAHDRLSDLPEVPELVVVCVPAAAVPEVVEEAGRLGVKAVCVISAGFAEVGAEGRARQDELMDIARGHGLRIVGPNCMGLMNAADDVRLNATFSDTFPRPGRVAFSSQSGALGLAVIDHVDSLGLGLSTFVSVGNKADISGNDLLLYWEEDDKTDVILLYLESFGNPRKFSRIARRVSRKKPIVAVKSGRTGAGERAASSHTAAISAGDVAVEALFAQTGIIRTDTLEELFDVATVLSTQPMPNGKRIGIVTNAGGPGILAADACESNGLSVPTLTGDLQSRLHEFLPPEAGVANPIDLVASATAEGMGATTRIAADSGEVDALLVIFVETGTTSGADVAHELVKARRAMAEPIPITTVFMSTRSQPEALEEAGIPTFQFPEDAARAMGRVAAHAQWRSTPLGEVVRPDGMDVDRARAIVEAAVEAAPDDTGVWLTQAQAEEVLDAYGVPRARSRIVATPEEAADVQREFATPVAIKVAAPIHKTDVGGIELDLDSPDEAAAAVTALTERLEAAGLGDHTDAWVVQEMADGIEMVVGVNHDPQFGPLVVTGLGGTLVELVRDVSVRVTPLTDRDVDEMLEGLRMRPLLDGYRGSAPADIDALRDLLLRVGAMVEDVPEIVELDLNPVFVRPRGQGALAVDVRCRVAG